MRSVLIVEDEAIIALDLVSSLEAMGYRVLGPVGTSTEAKQLACKEQPDLVLMDVSLKGSGDGIEAARTITRTTSAKVVFLTAHTDQATRAEAAAVQPEAFLTKPWSVPQMRAVLSAVFAC